MAKRPPTQRKKPLGSQVSATTQINVTEVSTMAERLESSGDRQGAISLYRSWLKSTKNSGTWIVWFNLGVLLRAEGDIESSIDAYKQSLEANPSSVHARINLGTALELVGQIDEAMAQWRNGLLQLDREENPSPELLCAVLNNLGRRLEVAQQYTEAEAMLTRSLRLNPKQDAVLYHRIYLRQKQCAWPIYDSLPGITEADQRHSTSAVAMLSITDDPVIQRGTALTQVPGKIPPNLPRLAPVGGYQHQRLRIGYLSSNFGMHAVSILTAELYELHDRSQFEVWGFCWSPEDNTEMRARVIGAMDHFVRINTLSDEAAAHAIRAAEIDILIDLQGLTSGCRPSILAYRPAPVQATYLG